MTGTIFDIKEMAVHDGPGLRTTVFFQGCPLRCKWCHNPEGLDAHPILSYTAHQCLACGACATVCHAHSLHNGQHRLDRTVCTRCGHCAETCLGNALKLYGKTVTVTDLIPLLLEDRLFYEQSDGGVTLSGGECLCQAEFCKELLKELKKEQIHTAVDTSGFVPQSAFDAVLPYTDLFLYDIKAYDETTHIACTGQSNRIILENLNYLDKQSIPIEIRIPFVPTENGDQLEKIAQFLCEKKNITKVKILPYHGQASAKYKALGLHYGMHEISTPTKDAVQQAIETFRAYGLQAE